MARMTREQSRAVTRERIMQAAVDVVARDGYDGASVDRIANAAGYSKGAFYSNFSSKEDVLNQLFERYAGQAAIDLGETLDGITDPEAIINAVGRWSDASNAEHKWGLIGTEFLRRAQRDETLGDRQRQPFLTQWRDVGNLLLEKLFPSQSAPIDPLDLGGIVMELSYGGISGFLGRVSSGQMLRQILTAFVAAHSSRPRAIRRPVAPMGRERKRRAMKMR